MAEQTATRSLFYGSDDTEADDFTFITNSALIIGINEWGNCVAADILKEQ